MDVLSGFSERISCDASAGIKSNTLVELRCVVCIIGTPVFFFSRQIWLDELSSLPACLPAWLADTEKLNLSGTTVLAFSRYDRVP